MTISRPRPPMEFRPGSRVAIRRNPETVGTVVAVRWTEYPDGAPARWTYETSWGSAYPAYELTPIATEETR